MKFRSAVGGQLLFDVSAWFLAIYTAVFFRFDFVSESVNLNSLFLIAAITSLLQFVSGKYFHLYRGRFKVATFEELKALLFTVLTVMIPMTVFTFFLGPEMGIPRSVFIISTPLFIILSGTARAFRRIIYSLTNDANASQRALIYGAGSMAEVLIPQLLNNPNSKYFPVGLIDDAPIKANRWINNVPMLGTWKDLSNLQQKTGAQFVIVCIARTDANFMKKIEEDCRKLGMRVIVFPTLDEVLQGRLSPSDLRAISIEDLIGRRPVDTKVEQISSYLEGNIVLVTGAGGSIGSELCRQIARYNPSKLIMLDRDETGLQLAQIGVAGHGLLDSNDLVLADIREKEVIQEIFNNFKPQVVFHAAALKHLPVLERFPLEAWKTNVSGTLNVLEAAHASGVQTFINISTDKAADPTSILGKSKKMAEGLTAWFAEETNKKFLSVRFGNVLGSRGSLLPTFSALIEGGGPLTVTHPEVSRFFMTIPEACQLVLQAGAIGRPQDVLILDMGEPVRILDIANRMIELSGKKIEIIFTGLRPGEKLHEDLYGQDENSEKIVHPLISHAKSPSISPNSLKFGKLD